MVYTYSQITTDVNNRTHGKSAKVPTLLSAINSAVRYVAGDIDLRSTKRKTQLSPGLFDKVYDYGAPADLKGRAIIDLKKQVGRSSTEEWYLTTEEEFDRTKTSRSYLIALADANFVRLLKLSGITDKYEAALNLCDSLTSNGSWSASGDASNLTQDSVNYVNSSASLNFDVAANFTSALIENSTIDELDLTDYENQYLFIWLYVPAIDGITSVKLRWGSSSSAYWEATATTNNEGMSFYTGWNLIRFAWPASSTGSPDITAVNYARVQVVGDGTNSASTDWRLDYIVARIGVIYDVIYYSKYLWQSSSGTYLENSTATTDYINVDTEEYELVLDKCWEVCSQILRDYDDWKVANKSYEERKQKYLINSPSEAKLLITMIEQ